MTPAEREEKIKQALRAAEKERERDTPAETRIKRSLGIRLSQNQPERQTRPQRRVGTANGICSGARDVASAPRAVARTSRAMSSYRQGEMTCLTAVIYRNKNRKNHLFSPADMVN